MTEPHVSSHSAHNDEQNELYINQSLFAELEKLSCTNRSAVSVMLALVARIEDTGAVQTSQAVMAQQCKITLKEVGEAIAHLSSAGLISAVAISPEPDGPLTCVVSPDLATAEKPEERI